MRYDIFTWSIGTAIISYILFFLIGMLTSNDLYLIIIAIVIFLISILILSKKNPTELSFKTGGILGIIIITSLILNGNIISSNIEELGIYFLIYLVSFFVAGFIGKLFIKKI